MKIPLHIPTAARFGGTGTYTANLQAATPAWLRVRAQFAFLMTQLGAAAAARSKTSRAQVNGFSTPSTKKRPGVHLDLSYADRCLVDAGMMPPPTPPRATEDEIRRAEEHRAAVRANREPSLTNYEQGVYLRIRREDPTVNRADFVGIRDAYL